MKVTEEQELIRKIRAVLLLATSPPSESRALPQILAYGFPNPTDAETLRAQHPARILRPCGPPFAGSFPHEWSLIVNKSLPHDKLIQLPGPVSETFLMSSEPPSVIVAGRQHGPKSSANHFTSKPIRLQFPLVWLN